MNAEGKKKGPPLFPLSPFIEHMPKLNKQTSQILNAEGGKRTTQASVSNGARIAWDFLPYGTDRLVS